MKSRPLKCNFAKRFIEDASEKSSTLCTALTSAALLLPGLIQSSSISAAEEDTVDFQYSHYQEGRRGETYKSANNYWGVSAKVPDAHNYNPIEVESLQGSARINLTDRVKFAFNYTQDTWSGATPMGSAPENSYAIGGGFDYWDNNGKPLLAGASPYQQSLIYLDKHRNLRYESYDSKTGLISYPGDRVVHVLTYASPETRQQGDFKLSYQWDEALLSLGGGISVENDYESRFVNLGGAFDFNQKQTTLDVGLSYTNSDINAIIDPLSFMDPASGLGHIVWTDRHQGQIGFNPATGVNTIRGTRQDWAASLGLTQVVNKNSVMKLGLGYTRNTGFLENPYKTSWIFGGNDTFVDSKGNELTIKDGSPFIEQRPDERNLLTWSAGWVQFIEPLNAALHFDYSFAHDDWGINAHTFEADWNQPIGWDWTITPRIRYYSQTSADFYQSYFTTDKPGIGLPDNFSSDQRLSGFGTLSGGITIAKDFAKGIRLETGIEYYTHQGSLKLGGGGEGSFADFDYWVANAALKVNLAALSEHGAARHHTNDHHHDHGNLPSGVLFGHPLEKQGDMMLGYRYMRNWQAGALLDGEHVTDKQQVVANACPDLSDGCSMLPKTMTMNMQMLDIMYAPTDWLTLMLMTHFMTMEMSSYVPDPNKGPHGHGGIVHDDETGGVGDTGMYALFKLLDNHNHHIHATLGVSAPTGDTAIRLKEGTRTTVSYFDHYGMQLGSGTWDFKPSLTYTGKAEDWSWGAQIAGTKRMESRNSSAYALGDMFEGSIWGGYDWTNWLSSTVRVAYSWQDHVRGEFYQVNKNEIVTSICNKQNFTSYDRFYNNGNPIGSGHFDQAAYNACLNSASLKKSLRFDSNSSKLSSMDFPSNYGGHYVDVGLGLSATVPTGTFAGNRLAFEWLQPVYTNVNGYQLDRDGALSFTWSYGF